MKIFVRSGKRPNRYSLILVVTCCLLWLNNAFANENKTPMIGSWKFDVDSSLARCERLQAHDCSTWENLDTEQIAVERDKYRKGFSHALDMTLEFSETEFTVNEDTHVYEIQQNTWSQIAITIVAEDNKKEWLVFLKEQPDVLCFAEKKKVQDVMCFRRQNKSE